MERVVLVEHHRPSIDPGEALSYHMIGLGIVLFAVVLGLGLAFRHDRSQR